MTTIVSDTFTRADSSTSLGTADTGQTWTALAGTWGIASNKAKQITSSQQAYAVVDSGHADNVDIQVTLGGTVSTGGGVSWRFTDANNGWFLEGNGTGASRIYQLQAGALSNVWLNATVFAPGDVMKVTVRGNVFTVYQNGVQVGPPYTDTGNFNLTATKHGLRDFGGVITLDNFTVDAPVAANGSLTLSGSVGGRGQATAAGSLALGGTVARPVTANGSLTLGAVSDVKPVYLATFTIDAGMELSDIPLLPADTPTVDYAGDDDSDLVTYTDPTLDEWGRPIAS